MSHRRLEFLPPFIAHRGARHRAPENTMPAFRAARQDGATWIEADIKLTQDGVPILMHDDMLERTTDGTGKVADMSWAEMQKLDAGKWFGAEFAGTRVPALAELIKFALESSLRLNLELKPCPGRTRVTTMVALIEVAKLWPENGPPMLISSFDSDALTIASQLHPALPRGLLMEEWRDDWRDMMIETHATTLHVDADLLTPDRLAGIDKIRTPILAFTVNDPVRARRLLGEGVRAIFTDNVAAMIREPARQPA